MAEGNKNDITRDMFKPADVGETQKEELTGEAVSYGRDAMRRLFKNKVALVSGIIILFIIVMAFVGPHFNEYEVKDQKLSRHNAPPRISALSAIPWFNGERVPVDSDNNKVEDVYKNQNMEDDFWFGTDKLGRDLWTRTWEGTQISLIIAFVAAVADFIIGIAYGGISGYFGGMTDNIMQRIVEILIGIPQLVIVILLIMMLQPGLLSLIIAIGMTGWIGQSRIVRAQILKLKTSEYVLAARTLGAKPSRLISKHLLPNAVGQIIITTMLSIPSAIFAEAFLSFIGIGISPPEASLGSLINLGQKVIGSYPYQVAIPAVVLSLLLICFNLLADGLRDALDPKMRQ